MQTALMLNTRSDAWVWRDAAKREINAVPHDCSGIGGKASRHCFGGPQGPSARMGQARLDDAPEGGFPKNPPLDWPCVAALILEPPLYCGRKRLQASLSGGYGREHETSTQREDHCHAGSGEFELGDDPQAIQCGSGRIPPQFQPWQPG